MALLFPSDEWIKSAMEKVNSSPDYAKAAASWEGDIVFIITDQQRFDTINALGFDYMETPNLDRMVNEGVIETDVW